MFENLPGADETKLAPVRQQSAVDAVRENKAAREEAQRRKDQTTVWDGIGAAQVKGGIGFIDRFVTSLGFEPTPDYRIPNDARKRWETLGLRPEQWELFGKATSDEHLSYLESIAFQNQMADEDLAQFGLGGNIALGLTDPVATGIDLASGGLGYAAKAGRIANMARSGLQAAAVTTVVQGASMQYDPSQHLEDLALNAATSFAFAGALGARRGALYDGDVDPARVKELATGTFGKDSLSAARVPNLPEDRTPGISPLREGTDREVEFADKALTNAHITPAYANIRRDLAARMGKAKSTLVREAGRGLFRDGVGYTDRSIAVQESATEFSKRHLGTLETEWRGTSNAAWADFKDRTGTHWWNYGARRQFNEEIGRAVRGDTDVSPEAIKAAQGVRQTMRDALKLAQESGLDGFDNIRNNPNYLPRYWSEKGFQSLFGEKGLTFDQVRDGLVKPAMRKAWAALADEGDEIDDELLSAVSNSYLKRAQANFEGDGGALLVRPLDSDSVEEIEKMLAEAGVAPVRMQEIMGNLERKTYEASKLARAKQRIDLDENFSTTLTNEAGETIQVKMSDLFDNDVESVMARYLREVTGWSALSSKLNVRNRAQLDRFQSNLKLDAKRAGDDVKDLERMVDIGIKSTFGRSTELDPASKGSRYARALRNWNFSRVMNQVGFSLFAELGPTIAHAGVRNFVDSTLAAKEFLIRGADGKLTSKEARVMESLFAPGTDWLRNPPFMRMDDDALAPPTFGNNRFGVGFDNALNGASHVTSVMSGMAPVNTMLQRIAGRATMLRMLDMANAKKLSTAEVARLRSWGLDEKAQADLFGYLKGKRKIDQIDPNAVSFETRERMAAFLFRVSRHQFLEGDASDSIELMHSTVGRLVTQFRSFMVNSYTRHFLNSFHHYDDWRTYMMVTLSASAAGMGWAARTYINTIGNEEQRKKQLTTANFYKNSIAQSSWSTAIPSITDFVWADTLGNDPIFSNNRSTGLSNGIMGIPTLDLANRVYGSSRMIGAAIKDDEQITEKQMQDFWKIWAFNNMTGARNLADYAIRENFPDRKDGTDK